MLGSIFSSGDNAVGMARQDLWNFRNEHVNESNRQDAREDAWRAANVAYDRQKEFAQMGIQWRVEDAKAAGLHPVFALNGGGAAYSPSVAVAQGAPASSQADWHPSSGQDLSRAVRATETPEQRAMADALLREVNARAFRSEEEGRLFGVQRMRLQGQAGPGLPTLLSTDGSGQQPYTGSVAVPSSLQYHPGNTDAINIVPHDVVSSVTAQPHLAPGVSPMWTKGDLGFGSTHIPRTNDFWETWGELSWYDKLAIAGMSAYLNRQERNRRMPAAKRPDWREVFQVDEPHMSGAGRIHRR